MTGLEALYFFPVMLFFGIGAGLLVWVVIDWVF